LPKTEPMKTRILLYSILISGIIGISGCGSKDKELRKDAKDIADIMCKSIESMKNLRTADPADSVTVQKLQMEYKKVETEMSLLYQEFKTKYGNKVESREFNEKFRKYLNESMLGCKSLSKEDREAFEKGMK
jgi:hypothetical protein